MSRQTGRRQSATTTLLQIAELQDCRIAGLQKGKGQIARAKRQIAKGKR
jgi:hypothetical protein